MSNKTSVVVGYDFTASGREALRRALVMAVRAPSHVLHFVCVIEPHAPNPAVPCEGRLDYVYAEKVQGALGTTIADELRALAATDPVHYFVHVRIGKPADEILMLAGEVGADLIVLGTKGLTGVERLVLGSVAERVVREAGCSVVVARTKVYPDVQLLEMHDKTSHTTYVPPHRYTYESSQVLLRPAEWPLY